MSSKMRRAIAIGMLVLLIIVSAVTLYLRENQALHAVTTVATAQDMSHPL